MRSLSLFILFAALSAPALAAPPIATVDCLARSEFSARGEIVSYRVSAPLVLGARFETDFIGRITHTIAAIGIYRVEGLFATGLNTARPEIALFARLVGFTPGDLRFRRFFPTEFFISSGSDGAAARLRWVSTENGQASPKSLAAQCRVATRAGT